jgi:hypothetical protein
VNNNWHLRHKTFYQVTFYIYLQPRLSSWLWRRGLGSVIWSNVCMSLVTWLDSLGQRLICKVENVVRLPSPQRGQVSTRITSLDSIMTITRPTSETASVPSFKTACSAGAEWTVLSYLMWFLSPQRWYGTTHVHWILCLQEFAHCTNSDTITSPS